jgi:uncharacterized membrane protein
MKTLIEWFGIDSNQFNEVVLNLTAKDLTSTWLLFSILITLALWFFWTSLNRIHSAFHKVLLIGLRALIFFFLLFILLKPELEFKNSYILKNRIAVLVDDTKSMSIKTFPSEQPRIDFVSQAFGRNWDALKSLSNTFQVDYYFASDQIDPISAVELRENYRPKKSNTDFGRVFSKLSARYEGKSLQGVMLFSDGADLMMKPETISPEFLSLLASWEGPIHTFQAGDNHMFKDLSIEEIGSVDFAFIHQPVRLAVTFNAFNMGNRNIPLVLKDGDTILRSIIVEVREGESRYPVDIEFTPSILGDHIYSLHLPLFAGESVATNNRKDFKMKVIRDRIRVLHLNGRPSWDSRFLREVLARNPKVDLLSFFILRTLDDNVASPTSELSLIPFPTNLLFSDYLNSFDLVLFQNFSHKPFIDKKYLNNIKQFVKNGGSFMMIGGELSFQGGGYSQTDIEEILPVHLEQASQTFTNEPFALQLEKNLLKHPILQLEKESEANKLAWQNLPELNGINTGLKPRKKSHVLASFIKGSKKYPVLVAMQVDKGRSLAIATDSLWNWNFRSVGEGGSGRHYHKFWNNIIDWLIDDSETRLLKLEISKETFEKGEDVLLQTQVLQPDYTPYAGINVQLDIKNLAGDVKSQSIKTNENGKGSFQFTPKQEGFYSVKARIEIDGRKLEEKLDFSVFNETVEYQKPRVNETLLRRIAEVSGGKYEVLSGTTDLSKNKFNNPRVEIKKHSKRVSLWDNWWIYGLILSLLFLDWFARRKSGLS